MPAGASHRCATCHQESGWSQVSFDHDATRLPLRGRHAEIACRGCHRQLHPLAIDPTCQSCHVDVHAGRLGTECARCHDQRSFSSGVGVQAHGATRFPLYGRHAFVPCDTCHRARSDRTWGGVPRSCEQCHRDDAARTAGTPFDHAPLGTPLYCRPCHTPVAWSLARFALHDRCFPITVPPHDGIACLGCHTSLNGLGVSNCATFTASCTRCHTCRETDDSHLGRVAGYLCADRRCYECHPTGGS